MIWNVLIYNITIISVIITSTVFTNPFFPKPCVFGHTFNRLFVHAFPIILRFFFYLYVYIYIIIKPHKLDKAACCQQRLHRFNCVSVFFSPSARRPLNIETVILRAKSIFISVCINFNSCTKAALAQKHTGPRDRIGGKGRMGWFLGVGVGRLIKIKRQKSNFHRKTGHYSIRS